MMRATNRNGSPFFFKKRPKRCDKNVTSAYPYQQIIFKTTLLFIILIIHVHRMENMLARW